jgi:hypothetical protein
MGVGPSGPPCRPTHFRDSGVIRPTERNVPSPRGPFVSNCPAENCQFTSRSGSCAETCRGSSASADFARLRHFEAFLNRLAG